MGEYTPENVFEELDKALKGHALFVETELLKLQTAMSDLKGEVRRRIDAVDERMDDFRKRHGETS